MKFKEGDIIFSKNYNLHREIVKVNKKSYLWIYPEYPDKIFNSINSNDPLLEWWDII